MVGADKRAVWLRALVSAAVFAILNVAIFDADYAKAIVAGVLFGFVMLLLDQIPGFRVDEDKIKKNMDKAVTEAKKNPSNKKIDYKIVR